jgi:hypothetical protein
VDALASGPCLDALCEAARELASTALGGAAFEALDAVGAKPEGHGAFVNLALSEEAIQVGLLLTPDGCQALAKLLLGMALDDEDLSLSDVGDAMCEIVNIVAGGLKRRLGALMPATLGLPLFVSGHPLPTHQQEVSGRALSIAAVPVTLLLLTQKTRGAMSVRGSTLHVTQSLAAKGS